MHRRKKWGESAILDTKAPAASSAKKARKYGGKYGGKAVRLPFAERREQILEEATSLFAQHGLTAQTRAIAAACGISQRLLYRFFPTKDDLVREVYDRAIVGPFRARWFLDLSDRSRPVHDRLCDFYTDYLDVLLSRRWLRLFLFFSLEEADLAPTYISSVITKLLETIAYEVAHELKVSMDMPPAAVHELAWTLHGAISHYAIRRHIYGASQHVPQGIVVNMHVGMFLGGFEGIVREFEKAAA